MYFAKDSAELTASDQAALDAYAQAYTQSHPSTDVVLDGYASIDGDKNYNQKLSNDRAQAVLAYLVSKGVPGKAMKAKGKGPIGSPKDDPRLNRRVTVSKLASAKVPASGPPGQTPGPQTPSGPADPPSKIELKQEHALVAPPPIQVPPKDGPKKAHPHAGADLSVSYPFGAQASLVFREVDLHLFDWKTVSVDLFHEPTLSLSIDPKSGLTSQELISLIHAQWTPPWGKDLELTGNAFFNQALTHKPGHLSGGGQAQLEIHTWDWLSVTLSISGTAGADQVVQTQGALLFHIEKIFEKKK